MNKVEIEDTHMSCSDSFESGSDDEHMPKAYHQKFNLAAYEKKVHEQN